MSNLVEITIQLVNTIFDHASMFLSSLSDGGFLSAAGSVVTVALALGAVVYGPVTEGVLASIRRWHGSIDEQFNNIFGIDVFVENLAQRFGRDYYGIRNFVSGYKYRGFFILFIRIFSSVVMLRRIAPVWQDKTAFYHRFITVLRRVCFAFFQFSRLLWKRQAVYQVQRQDNNQKYN
jgi:hypothetical protein